ncbi:MAG: S41 family peptidase [Pelistega sp.]|nr:S41 family peptidase [Pelistega sp.]
MWTMKKISKTVLLALGLIVTTAYAQEQTSPSATQVPDAVQSMRKDRPEEQQFSYDELRRFARAFALVKNQYVEPITDKELIDAAIDGMMSQLDPHSTYLDAEDMQDLQEDTDGEFGGLGIEIGEEKGHVKIISPIEGTPAAKAGVLPGDLIVKIDSESMKDKPMREVIKLLRGAPGSVVKLTIDRAGMLIDLDIKRELIKVRSVRSKMIDEVAYIRISQFQGNTLSDLATQIRAFKKEPKSLILDLRNDPGGLLNVSVGVVQVFADTKGTIVSTKARNQVVEEYSRYTPDNVLGGATNLSDLPKWLQTVPMVVLINVGSASASEIVAGALQDFKRATIMGNPSFGKGSVQVVLSIDDETGLKLTTARYYTPHGRSIQAKGIMPDILVSDTEKGDLFSYQREVDLKDHLKNDVSTEAKPKVEEEPKAELDKMYEFGSDEDFQLQQALNHLRGLSVNQGVISIKTEEAAKEDVVETSDTATPEAKTATEQAVENLSVPAAKPADPKASDKALDKALDKVREPKND